MSTKTITLTQESYEILKNVKKSGESFSEAVKRLFTPKADIMQFAGIMSDLSEKDAKEMKDSIKELKERSAKRFGE